MVTLNDIIKDMPNPFRNPTEEEIKERKKVELAVKNDIKNLSAIAKQLFDDNRYKRLREEFEKIYEQTIRLMVYFDCEDPHKYIMKMRQYQIQIRTLKNIFDTPEGFVKSEEAITKRTVRE